MIISNLDRWDRREFLDAMEHSTEMKDAEIEGSRKVPNYAEFMADIFGGMYKYSPSIRDQESAPANEQWADQIYQEVSNLQEWKTLRERTVMNPEAAAAATHEFCNNFIDSVPDLNQNREEYEKVEVGYDGEYHEVEHKIQPLTEDQLSAIRHAARGACEQATAVADETTDTINAFGYGAGNQIGNNQYASPNKKKEVARRLMDNEHLKKIADLAGRFRRIAVTKQKQKTKHGVDEIADVIVGDDLGRLIPAELAKFLHPALKRDFQRKFLEKSLMQYRLRGKERQGRGPIIVCIDESGSMMGERDVWAKAIAMALLQIAINQNRRYAMVHFESQVTRTDHFHKPVDPVAVMDAVSYFRSGGTNFMEPLNRAVQIIAEDRKNYKKADIVFITDGDASITDEWLDMFKQAKKQGEFNVISIIIGYNRVTVCDQFSDHVFNIHDLTKTDEALNTMFSI
jgi:uncharacterized protein with von Willebrand factor type A (vWA) domain